MKLHHNLYSIKNFYSFNKNDKKNLIKHILKDKEKYDNKPQSKKELGNFKIRPHSSLSNMYDKFLDECKSTLGEFKLFKHNSKDFHCLCTNKNYYASVPHDHMFSSTIVGVYYLNVPDNKGAILFKVNDEWGSYQPSEKELLIFPSYLEHDTLKNDTEEWRISINMEILCNHIWLR